MFYNAGQGWEQNRLNRIYTYIYIWCIDLTTDKRHSTYSINMLYKSLRF